MLFHWVKHCTATLIALWLSAPVALAMEASPHTISPDQLFSFAVVPQYTPQKVRQIWQPILTAVEHASGIRLKLIVPPNIQSFEHDLYAGKYDFAYMNPYHLLIAHRQQDYRPILANAHRTLRGIIVVSKRGGIKRLSELSGLRMAFPAPDAFAASMLIRSELKLQYHISVIPWYVVNHSSVFMDVALGLAPAGGGVYATLQQQPRQIRQRLRVLYETPPMPTHPIAVDGHRVPPSVVHRVTDAFLGLKATREGRHLLAAVPFVEIEKTSYDRYRPLEALDLNQFVGKGH